MLNAMMSSREVGFYAAGIKLAEALNFIPVVVLNSLFPMFVNIEKQENLFWDRFYKVMLVMFWSLSLVALFISIFSKVIISLLFGVSYIEAYKVLAIYIWTLPILLLGTMTSKYLLILNKQKILFFRQFLFAISNVGLNLYLIPKIGLIGAAISTIIPQLFFNTVFDVFLSDMRPLLKTKLRVLSFNITS
jgi:O-antigen/teichoic acid export membrane protein